MQSPRRRRQFPFYKIQVFDEAIQSWKDEPRAFDSLELAKAQIEKKLFSKRVRVVVVDRDGRRVLDTE